MIIALRVLLALLGALFVFIGFGFLTDPVGSGGDFGLSPNGNQGLSSIRADFTAFFWVSGGAFLIGAWKQNGPILLVTAALMGITCFGRAVSVVLDGSYEAWFMPMTVEAIAVILGITGARVFSKATAG